MAEQNYPPKMPTTVAATINTKIGEAEVEEAPYGWSLTPKERRGGAKMGPDSVSFVEAAINALNSKPDVMPRRFVDTVIAETFAGNRTLEPLVNQAESLARSLEDASIRLGEVAYGQALEIYNQFQEAVKKDSSLQPDVDEMAKRFEKLKGPRDKPED